MPEVATAEAALERLLYVLPAAGRKGGAALAELARALDTTPRRILDDLAEVTGRAYYHPGGWPDDVSIHEYAGRVEVWHASGFERPARLSRRETLCLALALRGTAAASHLRDPEGRRKLLARAEAHLGPAPVLEDGGTSAVVHAGDHAPDPAGIRETLLFAARHRHPCAIVYAKLGASDLEARVVHPYTLAYAEGAWYVVGWCAVKRGMRAFRLDRILEAADAEGTFEVPADFDVAEWVQGARVYHADADVEVRVRYSPRIARWVRERAAAGASAWEEEPDGSVVLSHRVADPHWVVSHALGYGPDAEILGPEEVRDLMRAVLEGMGE